MDHSDDICNIQGNGNGRGNNGAPSTSASAYKLFGRQTSFHQMMGGGKGKFLYCFPNSCHSTFTFLHSNGADIYDTMTSIIYEFRILSL